MPSDFENLFSELALPALDQFAAETVTRYPRGDVSAANAAFSGIFSELPAAIDESSGRRIRRRATLVIDDGTTWHLDDVFVKSAEEWRVVNWHAEHGRIVLQLARVEKELSTNAPAKLI